MRRIVLTALVVAGLVQPLFGTPSAAARTALPPSFFGVVPQGPLEPADFEHMSGVIQTLRIPIIWSKIEPRQGEFDFTGLDATVAAAAAAGVRVLPFVYGTPAWLTEDPARPPLSAEGVAAWSQFLRLLIGRYGPGGGLWQGAPKQLPIRQWQIWNEPNFLLFWRPRPSPKGYASLLRTSARTIRKMDPRARVIAAGLAPVEGGMLPWTFLRKLYAVPGARGTFDMAAVHPYSPTVREMAYQVRKARQVMAAAGDGGTPLLISELGVASGSSLPTAFNWGAKGQASFLSRAYGLLLGKRRRWHIAGIDWYAWRDTLTPDPHCVFCEHAGLFGADGDAKPSWRALRRVAAAAHSGA